MSLLKNNIAVALDQMTPDEALNFVRETKNDLGFYKIGLELYYSGGKQLIKKIENEGVRIFLDLKLHDIPTTVAKSIEALGDLNIDYLTLHLTGGPSMLKAAKVAQEKFMPNTRLLGVSFLTSLNSEEIRRVYNISTAQTINLYFNNLFSLAVEERIHGVVHSGEELPLALNYHFISVCPGIRFPDEMNNSITHDQKRIIDPKTALNFQNVNKSIILVIGRSLTQCPQDLRNERIQYLKNL